MSIKSLSSFFFLSLFVSANVYADTTLIINDIPYYSEAERQADPYKRKRGVLDLYCPESDTPLPTIIWFHGGGLRSGGKHFPTALQNQNVCIVAPNYRLYPQVNSPSYIKDAAAAVAWTFKNIHQHGGDKNLIFVSGHSAGGYLALMVGLDKKWLAMHKVDANQIAGLIPFSGHTITHFTIREERGIAGTQPIVDEMAPLFHVRNDAPPLLLITGDREKELLGRYEENAYMKRMMKVVGHKQTTLFELDGYGHNMVAPALPLLLNEVKRLTTNNQNN